MQEAKLANMHLQFVTEAGVCRYQKEVNRNMDAKVMVLWDMNDTHYVVCEGFLLDIGSIYGNLNKLNKTYRNTVSQSVYIVNIVH
jgi:hypothetical protein